jgi:PTS system mannose-specific IID component
MKAPLWRAFLRLFSVQGAWNYERMLGIGMGYAALPLLQEMRQQDPAGYREAVARQAEFFNAQPYLAGLALGATTRAEYQGVPGEKILRLRTALCGPLGALGDQLFWTGILPALVSTALVMVAFGLAGAGLLGFLVVFNGIRVAVEWWGLRAGWASGLEVSQVLHKSWLPKAVALAGPAAGFAMGVALPVIGGWLVADLDRVVMAGALGAAGIAVVMARVNPQVTGLRFTLVVATIILLSAWVGA